jgi:hypothetical protein
MDKHPCFDRRRRTKREANARLLSPDSVAASSDTGTKAPLLPLLHRVTNPSLTKRLILAGTKPLFRASDVLT